MSGYALLAEIAGPVPKDRRPREIDWLSVEREIGFMPPGDYRAFIEDHGGGCFKEEVFLLDPTATNPNLNLLTRGRRSMAAHGEMASSFPDAFDARLRPGCCTFFPFASDNNGEEAFWMFEDGAVGVATFDMEAARVHPHLYEESTTEFLAKVLTGAIRTETFAWDVADHPSLVRFRPLDELW